MSMKKCSDNEIIILDPEIKKSVSKSSLKPMPERVPIVKPKNKSLPSTSKSAHLNNSHSSQNPSTSSHNDPKNHHKKVDGPSNASSPSSQVSKSKYFKRKLSEESKEILLKLARHDVQEVLVISDDEDEFSNFETETESIFENTLEMLFNESEDRVPIPSSKNAVELHRSKENLAPIISQKVDSSKLLELTFPFILKCKIMRHSRNSILSTKSQYIPLIFRKDHLCVYLQNGNDENDLSIHNLSQDNVQNIYIYNGEDIKLIIAFARFANQDVDSPVNNKDKLQRIIFYPWDLTPEQILHMANIFPEKTFSISKRFAEKIWTAIDRFPSSIIYFHPDNLKTAIIQEVESIYKAEEEMEEQTEENIDSSCLQLMRNYEHDNLLKCRMIKIGSLRVKSSSQSLFIPALFTDEFFIVFLSVLKSSSGEEETLALKFQKDDLMKVMLHHDESLPAIVIYAHPEAAKSVREQLGMTDPKNGPYYDPGSNDESQKRIIIIGHSIVSEHIAHLYRIYPNLIKEIDLETTKHTLKRSQKEVFVQMFEENKLRATLSILSSHLDKNGWEHSVIGKTNTEEPLKKLLVYPLSLEAGSITITRKDLECLSKREFINDVIIGFYLNYIFANKVSSRNKQRYYIFNTFFYTGLSSKYHKNEEQKKKLRHETVKKWTRNVDIFEKDFLVFPINIEYHWFLVIVCFPNLDLQSGNEEESRSRPQPCILILNSIPAHKWVVAWTIRDYLSEEWKAKKGTDKIFDKTTMPGFAPKVPRQANSYDCGIYILQYLESFFEDPIVITKEQPMKNYQLWFTQPKVLNKRQEIKNLIMKLGHSQQKQVKT